MRHLDYKVQQVLKSVKKIQSLVWLQSAALQTSEHWSKQEQAFRALQQNSKIYY